MKAKLAGSADKRDSVLAGRRADKMRSFNVRSAIKNQGQVSNSFLLLMFSHHLFIRPEFF